MGVSLINKIKYNPIIYNIYYYIGSFILKLIGLFIKIDNKLIMFVSFGGRKYDDSPRCIYEKMVSDKRFAKYKFIWAFIEPEKQIEYRGESVKIDTIRYFYMLLKSKYWITNSSVERGLSIKRNKNIYLNTWHGSAIKKMGNDIVDGNTSFSKKGKDNTDIMLAQGEYDVNIFSRVFGISCENFKIVGLPRNDELVASDVFEKKEIIKTKLDIPKDKKIILYAPTFREYTKDANNNCVMEFPISLKKWKNELSDRYVVLLRAHYEIINSLNIESDEFVINVSNYPNLNELMIASDLLISDYSSIFFDYSLLLKPMLCFAYDYDIYNKKRGLYFDIRKELRSYIDDEDKLISELKKMPEHLDKYKLIAREFRDKYITIYGNATASVLDMLYRFEKN